MEEEVKDGTHGKRLLPADARANCARMEPQRSTRPVPSAANNVDGPLQVPFLPADFRAEKSNGKRPAESLCRRLKFQNQIYKVGDTVLIREAETTDMVARIERVLKENGDLKHPTWPMIEVTW